MHRCDPRTAKLVADVLPIANHTYLLMRI
jgi:hypothetical protein